MTASTTATTPTGLHDRIDSPVDVRWRDRGACRHHPEPGLWFPTREPGNDPTGDNHGRQARAICVGCPVRVECLTDAVARDEPYGLHGGAGEDMRRWLRRAWMADGPDAGPVWRAAVDEHFGRLDGLKSSSELRPVGISGAVIGLFPSPINRNGPGATHGRRVTYARGCRCWLCGLAAGVDGLDMKPQRVAA